jgi:uncharacterized membrane protein
VSIALFAAAFAVDCINRAFGKQTYYAAALWAEISGKERTK